jgi:hypothetical protein
MKPLFLSAIALSSLLLGSTVLHGTAQAQTQTPIETTPAVESVAEPTDSTVQLNPFDLQRARNLARQAAERRNGGLEYYRADPAMHGPTINAPFIDNGNGTVTFSFTGGTPGYTVPTVESVVTVNPADNWAISVDYNGPIRQSRAQ